ncbi:MAG: DUF4388 domain-containing protein [Candidatus Fermentibacteria bacterium]|nr:DUF4388 domain-containing protein [Candidatus Fermentibacteria bacterium]
MAFNGNLSEFGVVALLQLPGTNHLTGKLVLEQSEARAEFFYSKGKLVHAVCGEITGKEALLEVIDWIEGDFAFDSTSHTEEVTIERDLQNTLMWALKEQDELKKRQEEEEKAASELAARKVAAAEQAAREQKAIELAEQAKAAAALAENLPEPVIIPQSIIGDPSAIQVAYLINSKGQITGESTAEPDYLNKIKPILPSVQSFIRNYPNRVIGKTFIEDSELTLAFSGITEKITAVIFLQHNTRMGVLNIELGKFLRSLKASGLEILND